MLIDAWISWLIDNKMQFKNEIYLFWVVYLKKHDFLSYLINSLIFLIDF